MLQLKCSQIQELMLQIKRSQFQVLMLQLPEMYVTTKV